MQSRYQKSDSLFYGYALVAIAIFSKDSTLYNLWFIFILNSQTTAIIKVKSKANMGITVLVDLILGKK
jgi:hypothetical protein